MHDFALFPELTNAQMDEYYFLSPHKQITQDFFAQCVKVHDGDTITLLWVERDFTFPVRFINIAAPELSADGGKESQQWLEAKLLGEEVGIHIQPDNRVDKWGRLLGKVYLSGFDVGEESIIAGQSLPWARLNEGMIIDTIKLPGEWA